MSLIGVDGSAYSFAEDTAMAHTTAPPAPMPAIATKNSFQFDEMEEPNPAASSSTLSLFSSAPISLTAPAPAPLQFAPSNPKRVQPGQVNLDFSEFENEITEMDNKKKAEFLESLEVNRRIIAETKDGKAALPSQIGDSKLFHSIVLKQYGSVADTSGCTARVVETRTRLLTLPPSSCASAALLCSALPFCVSSKVHNLEVDAKKAFASRKANKRDARRAKKAEDKADQMEAKSGGAIRRNMHKNRAKGIY